MCCCLAHLLAGLLPHTAVQAAGQPNPSQSTLSASALVCCCAAPLQVFFHILQCKHPANRTCIACQSSLLRRLRTALPRPLAGLLPHLAVQAAGQQSPSQSKFPAKAIAHCCAAPSQVFFHILQYKQLVNRTQGVFRLLGYVSQNRIDRQMRLLNGAYGQQFSFSLRGVQWYTTSRGYLFTAGQSSATERQVGAMCVGAVQWLVRFSSFLKVARCIAGMEPSRSRQLCLCAAAQKLGMQLQTTAQPR